MSAHIKTNTFTLPISRTTIQWLICILGFGATFFYLHKHKQNEYNRKQEAQKYNRKQALEKVSHTALDARIHKLHNTQSNAQHISPVDVQTTDTMVATSDHAQTQTTNIIATPTHTAISTVTAPTTNTHTTTHIDTVIPTTTTVTAHSKSIVAVTSAPLSAAVHSTAANKNAHSTSVSTIADDSHTLVQDITTSQQLDNDIKDTTLNSNDNIVDTQNSTTVDDLANIVEEITAAEREQEKQAETLGRELMTQDALLENDKQHRQKAERIIHTIGPKMRHENDIVVQPISKIHEDAVAHRLAEVNDKLAILQSKLSQTAQVHTCLLDAVLMFDARNILLQQQAVDVVKQKSIIFAKILAMLMPLNEKISTLFARPYLELTLCKTQNSIPTYYSEIRNVIQNHYIREHNAMPLQMAVDTITPLLEEIQIPYDYIHNTPYVPCLTDWLQQMNSILRKQYNVWQQSKHNNIVNILQIPTARGRMTAQELKSNLYLLSAYAIDLSIIYGSYCTGIQDMIVKDIEYRGLVYKLAQQSVILLQTTNALAEVVKHVHHRHSLASIYQKQDLQSAHLFYAYKDINEAYGHKVRPYPLYDLLVTPPTEQPHEVCHGLFAHAYSDDSDPINVMVKYAIFIHPLRKYFQYNSHEDTVTLREDKVNTLLHRCMLLSQEVTDLVTQLSQRTQEMTDDNVQDLLNISMLTKKVYALNLFNTALNPDHAPQEYEEVAQHIECDDILRDVNVLNRAKCMSDFLANTQMLKNT